MFKTPIHEVLDWPAWGVALLAEYLAKEPPADERVEIAVAHLAALYVNGHRRKGDPPHPISDFLLFRDAWKQDEPVETIESLALSLGTVKRGNHHS